MTEHRNLEVISAEAVEAEVAQLPANQFVYFTGGEYRYQRGSARSAALTTIREPNVLISLRDYARRAARIDGDKGVRPSFARSALALHQGSKPAVYLYLEERPNGDLVSVSSIPHPDGFTYRFEPGSVVFRASQRPRQA